MALFGNDSNDGAMSLEQACAEAKRFGVFVKAVAKINEVADSLQNANQVESETRKRVESLLGDISKLNLQVTERTAQLNAADGELAQARASIQAEAEKAISDANARARGIVATAQGEREAFEDANRHAANDLAKVNGDLEKARAELDALNRHMAALKSRAKAMIGG